MQAEPHAQTCSGQPLSENLSKDDASCHASRSMMGAHRSRCTCKHGNEPDGAAPPQRKTATPRGQRYTSRIVRSSNQAPLNCATVSSSSRVTVPSSAGALRPALPSCLALHSSLSPASNLRPASAPRVAAPATAQSASLIPALATAPDPLFGRGSTLARSAPSPLHAAAFGLASCGISSPTEATCLVSRTPACRPDRKGQPP